MYERTVGTEEGEGGDISRRLLGPSSDLSRIPSAGRNGFVSLCDVCVSGLVEEAPLPPAAKRSYTRHLPRCHVLKREKKSFRIPTNSSDHLLSFFGGRGTKLMTCSTRGGGGEKKDEHVRRGSWFLCRNLPCTGFYCFLLLLLPIF